MRILTLTAGFPYPPVSGGILKTLSVLNHLHPKHQVRVVCFNREPLTAEQSRWADDFGKVHNVLMRGGRNPLNPATLAWSYLHRLPLGIERSRSREMRDAVSEALGAGEFDAVFVDHWLVAQYLPDGFAGRRLLHEHNAEYVIWRRYATRERNLLRRALLQLEARRVRRYEAAILSRFDTIFAVSETDRRALIEIGGRPEHVRVLPNLPDAALLDLPSLSPTETEAMIFYLGTLSWPPNLEGLAYFLRSVFPLVRARAPETRFVIAGSGDPPSWLERLARSGVGVEFLGPIDDPEPLYRKARVLVETTRSGGGTKLKILNALARGLPVVATPEAIEGLEVTPGRHILTGDQPQSLADAIIRVMTDGDLWQSMSDSGRDLVRGKYLAEQAFAPLDEALDGARG
jgi:glycosyltransferase involved in cell wall biosynthesis